MTANTSTSDTLAHLARVIESRLPQNGGDPDTSYVARLLHKGPNAFLKKIGEEATEVVMAAKDADNGGDKTKVVYEVADLWFHCMIALAHYGLSPADVVVELDRRAGTSGIEEKAMRKVTAREDEQPGAAQ
ncbi:phosphoribosyl-ATP pyrophosphatase [Rhodoferax ferrireducens T118]|uniref:Phosphoribosyl-ATP pyrophosphatase n=1 Tax=Albidiferax ferrireducens (strain ATCC BAA-621 / DSM 15236 / T118) TaxID=338969 RepID=HIS2_ALBFT|nr:phosphoribosyl-ATP diphosphatase [Rhodoferax ferrireducens]Q21U89.1 RecName: Full=Phosphoribosyl-ATP pyrophosphatase; Short=PRA-PH [Rhodoferax ferrireducens T118]ABD70664.1 phosphoribosyl-ATP pyrophosphatase [Rhodoferax ferrireducens T118]